jgi:extradiol dioxygenase family protein
MSPALGSRQGTTSFKNDPRAGGKGNAHICLALKDLDQLYHRLKSAGVDFVSAPVVSTGGHYTGSKTVYLHDPDGISLQLMEIHKEEGQR